MGDMIYLQYPGDGEPVAVATGFSWGALSAWLHLGVVEENVVRRFRHAVGQHHSV